MAIQLNDTHPAIAIAELMRVFIDELDVTWDDAWKQTVATFGYTNHTLLPEALERWPVGLFERLLPRHLEIIYEINRRFLRQVMDRMPRPGAGRADEPDRGAPTPRRMAHLAGRPGHPPVSNVAKLHTDLIEQHLLKDFYELWPERFNNKTNGVTPRRWLLACNPGLAKLITEKIGERWTTHLEHLKELEPHVADAGFRARLREVKRANKAKLAKLIHDEVGIGVDPASIFDCPDPATSQYKRQHLNALHIIHRSPRAARRPGHRHHALILAPRGAPTARWRSSYPAHPRDRLRGDAGQEEPTRSRWCSSQASTR